MKSGKRIEVIKRVAFRLAAEDDWAEIDLYLEQFGFETSSWWEGDEKSYVIHHLKSGDDGSLAAIDQYLRGHSDPDDEPWEGGGFRLFLTHVDTEKQVAHSLKSDLRDYGVDAFVAHADIKPGKEWPLVLESALHRCDASAALLHKGFRKSDWCDQEVGISLGRGIPVIPIHYDLLPYGFIGMVQAIKDAGLQPPEDVARSLVLVLLKDKRTSGKLTQAIVDKLADANSFDQANILARLLANEAPLLTKKQVKQLRKAEKENSQIQGAWHFDGHLSLIEDKIDAMRRIESP